MSKTTQDHTRYASVTLDNLNVIKFKAQLPLESLRVLGGLIVNQAIQEPKWGRKVLIEDIKEQRKYLKEKLCVCHVEKPWR